MNNLIVTLPSLYDKNLIDRVLTDDAVIGARYNSGVNELFDTDELLNILKIIKETYHKKIWIDLKGRQLRIEAWADPRYDVIKLNHEIEIEYPAYILFRGSGICKIAHTKRNEIVLENSPKMAVGKGQSVNIFAKSLDIKGYLTEKDKILISTSSNYGLNDYMASFVESYEDLNTILSINKNASIISKIESLKGIQFIKNANNLSLMAARDDLYIENNFNKNTIDMLKLIIKKDGDAICASRLFSNLVNNDSPSLSDYIDIEYMKQLGYKTFMLGDDIRGEKLIKALRIWKEI